VILGRDGRVDGPLLVLGVLDSDGLSCGLSYDGVEIELLKLGRVLGDGLAHHLEVESFTALHFASDLSFTSLLGSIHVSRVESHF
jgi:hypothetical protein